MNMTSTESSAKTTPNAKAPSAETRPEGMGRLAVRVMIASISRSYHMLMAPAAPAPTAMHKMAINAKNGLMCSGAITRPIAPVKTTSDMTRGLSRAIQSDAVAPSSAVKTESLISLSPEQKKSRALQQKKSRAPPCDPPGPEAPDPH
jgi:hypothetical protein